MSSTLTAFSHFILTPTLRDRSQERRGDWGWDRWSNSCKSKGPVGAEQGASEPELSSLTAHPPDSILYDLQRSAPYFYSHYHPTLGCLAFSPNPNHGPKHQFPSSLPPLQSFHQNTGITVTQGGRLAFRLQGPIPNQRNYTWGKWGLTLHWQIPKLTDVWGHCLAPSCMECVY